MNSLLRELESVATTFRELSVQLTESFYEENQIYLGQRRIDRLRANIARERERIAQLRMVLHRRREQEKYRKEKSGRDKNASSDDEYN